MQLVRKEGRKEWEETEREKGTEGGRKKGKKWDKEEGRKGGEKKMVKTGEGKAEEGRILSSTLDTAALYSHLHCTTYHSNADPIFLGLDTHFLWSHPSWTASLVPAFFPSSDKSGIDGLTRTSIYSVLTFSQNWSHYIFIVTWQIYNLVGGYSVTRIWNIIWCIHIKMLDKYYLKKYFQPPVLLNTENCLPSLIIMPLEDPRCYRQPEGSKGTCTSALTE